ncbi:MAG: hypothetical protein WCA14_03680 [Steroidobacteraceae bacterium]
MGETKKCPFCAEEVQAAAVKCKHCGSQIPTPPEISAKRVATGALLVIIVIAVITCSYELESPETSAPLASSALTSPAQVGAATTFPGPVAPTAPADAPPDAPPSPSPSPVLNITPSDATRLLYSIFMCNSGGACTQANDAMFESPQVCLHELSELYHGVLKPSGKFYVRDLERDTWLECVGARVDDGRIEVVLDAQGDGSPWHASHEVTEQFIDSNVRLQQSLTRLEYQYGAR